MTHEAMQALKALNRTCVPLRPVYGRLQGYCSPYT